MILYVLMDLKIMPKKFMTSENITNRPKLHKRVAVITALDKLQYHERGVSSQVDPVFD